MEDVGNLACKAYGSTHEDDHMLICDKCGDAYHSKCHGITKIPKGLWYYTPCMESIMQDIDPNILYNFYIT